MQAAGITAPNREIVARLNRDLVGVFGVGQASETLGETDLTRTRRLLAYLTEKGWLVRVSHGLYATVPLDAHDPAEWRVDPWIVADRLFGPDYYIGGWSAAQHWDLTEQIFTETMVMTVNPQRGRVREVQGHKFRVRTMQPTHIFGVARVWRDRVRVSISNPARTIVDVLDDPAVGGGLHHVTEVLKNYLDQHGTEPALIDYGDRLGNRTVFKRLGYLLDVLGAGSKRFKGQLRRRVSEGITLLDPALPDSGQIVTGWNLRINTTAGQQ